MLSIACWRRKLISAGARERRSIRSTALSAPSSLVPAGMPGCCAPPRAKGAPPAAAIARTARHYTRDRASGLSAASASGLAPAALVRLRQRARALSLLLGGEPE